MKPNFMCSLSPCVTQVDVYAFGVMLNEMMGREVPFGGCGVPEIRAAVLSGQRPDMPLSCPKVGHDQCYVSVPSSGQNVQVNFK